MTEEANLTLDEIITATLQMHGLTKPQISVTLLFLKGKSAIEIAETLGTSRQAVSRMLKVAEKKLHTKRSGFAWLVLSSMFPRAE